MRTWAVLLLGLFLLLSAVQCADCMLDDSPEHVDGDDLLLTDAVKPACTTTLQFETLKAAPLRAAAPPLHRLPRPPIA